MIFTKLARAAARCALILPALLLPRAAQAAADNFNGGAVSNCTYASATQTYSCSALSTSDDITIASGYTVVLAGSINFDFNQQLNMSGSAKLQTTGSLNIGNVKPSNLNITGGTLAAGTSFSIGAQAQTIVANVTAASMNIGTGSATKITGALTCTGPVSLASHVTIVGPISGTAIDTNSPVDLTGDVTASTSFDLASGSHMVGNITAPTVTIDPSSVTVNGNIAASGSLSVGSGNTVNGNVSGGSLSLASSGVVINGNATMTGDVSLGASDTINGDLVARNVSTASSDDYISGNAQVNTIELDWRARVGKTITCTGAGASGCSCVTNNSGYTSGPNAPVCGAATPSTADHIQITHSGSGLTCQPATVTITACANAACSANYTGSAIAVKLLPGGQTFTITGSGSGTVSQTTAGNATLSATSTGVNGANVCVNTGAGNNSCTMNFATAGLELIIPNHKSGETQDFSLRALQSNPSGTACVAALAGTTQTVQFSCGYVNPSSTPAANPAAPSVNGVALGAGGKSNAACGSGSNVSVAFNNLGVATPNVTYPDVGQMSLSASFTPPVGQQLSGSGSFIVAPYAFKFFATQTAAPNLVNPEASDASGSAFIGAGQVFTTKMAAVNKSNGITYNFGRESTPEYVGTVTPGLVAPVGGQFPALKDTSGHDIAFPAMSNGSASLNMYFNEVGIVQLAAFLHNPAGYLGSGFSTSGTTNIGRFVPDHFNTAVSTTQMDCTLVTGASKPCPSPNGSGKFLYSRQPFDLAVSAYSAANATYPAGAITANYTGSFAKAVTIEAWRADATPNVLQNPPSAAAASLAWKSSAGAAAAAGIPASAFAAGVGNSTTSGDSHPEYDFVKYYTNNPGNPNMDDATSVPVSLYLRARDTDNVSSLRLPVPSPSGEALLSIVSGRLLVANIYGSPSTNAPVKVYAQYWTGSTYVSNPAYVSVASTTLSAGSPANVSFSNCLLKTGASCSAPSLQSGAALNFQAGAASFNLAPLSAAGAVDLTFAWPVPSPALPNLIYLPSTTGRVTFGVYRAGPVVYLREVF